MSSSDRISELLLRWEAARREGRQPTVQELCADCPEAEAAEIAELLHRRIAAIISMEQRLDVSPSGLAATLDDSAAQASRDVLRRQPIPLIPGYDILEVVDQGGMGIVYRAVQSSLQRVVAIKMLAALGISDRHAARFQSEAEAVARLQHPHIVQIFDVGQVDGRPYFAMEYLDGGTLAAWMSRERLQPRRAAEIVETLARAMHAAHERGIVHRDLKPSNVLMAADGTLKVADFGLAKRLGDTPDLTHSGEIMGTPGYMAPEQAAGERAQIGPATDVYALGAILYELLTGRPPFVGNNPIAILRQVTADEPIPVRRLEPSVSRDLEAICLKCLEKTSSRRYVSAQELADDLRRFLDGRPIIARRAGPARRLVKYVRRHPGRASLIGLALLLALVPVWGETRHQWTRYQLRRKAEALAPQAYEILRRNCYECHGQNPKQIEKKLNVLNHRQLVDNERRIVVPGAPHESRLIQRIADGSMPPEEKETSLPRLCEEELSILNDWILGGAPELPADHPHAEVPSVVAESAVAGEVKRIFELRCYKCHRFDVARGGIKILHHRLLLHVRKVVVPGKPEESELFELITTDNAERCMPPQPAPRLPPQEVDAIKQWILAGAPPFPKAK